MAAKQETITEILRAALFGEKKKTGSKTAPTQEKSGGSTANDSQIALLRSIAANARISARNSMALPSILQQTNIMQKNVAKLVRIQGVKSTSEASSFFSDSKFRENAYEAEFRKAQGDSKTPSQIKSPEKKSIAGLFGSLFGIFKSVFNVDFLKKVLIGGAIIGGLTKYFNDPEFKTQVDNMLAAIRDAFFSAEGWKKFKSAALDMGLLLGKVVLVLGAFKLALIALSSYISGMAYAAGVNRVLAGGVPVPGPGGKKPGLLRRFGGWMLRNPRKALIGGIAGGIGLDMAMGGSDAAAAERSPADFTASPTVTPSDAGGLPVNASPTVNTPAQAPQQNSQVNGTKIALNTALAGIIGADTVRRGMDLSSRAARFATGAKPGMMPLRQVAKWKSVITNFMTKGWGARLLKRLPEKLVKSGIGKRVLKKVILFVAGLFGIGPGWVVSAISALWLIADVLWVIDIIEECFYEFEKEDAAGNQAIQASKGGGAADGADGAPTPAGAPDGAAGSQDNSFLQRIKQAFGVAAAVGIPGYGAFQGGLALGQSIGGRRSNAPPGMFKNVDFSQVKDKIIAGEGTAKYGNPYEEVFAYGAYGKPPKKLTDMTLAEVQAFQSKLIANTKGKGIRGLGENEGTGAVGAYQFTKDTLATIAAKVFGPGWEKQKFTPEVQDALAKNLFDAVKSNNAKLSPTWAYFSDLNAAGAQLRAQGSPGGSLNFKPTASAKQPAAAAADADANPTAVDAATGVPVKVGQVQRPAGAFNRATGGMFGDIYNNNSTQVITPPTTAGGSAAVTMASVYDSQLQHLLLNQAIGIGRA